MSQMTQVEKEILSDPFLSETVDVNFAARSEAFQDAYRRKFGIAKPEPHPFDVALDNRINQDPKAVFTGKLNAMMRDPSVRNELMERDPKFRQKWKGNLIEQEAARFRQSCPDYHVSQWNYEILTDWLARNLLDRGGLDSDEAVDLLWEANLWTAENLKVAYLKCLEAGGLQVKPGMTRNLTQQEELEIISIAQMNGPADAIVRFIELSLGELPGDNNSASAVARFRAQNPAACNRATLWVFRQLRANGLTDSNWQDFAETVSARNPLLTFAMLDEEYIEWSRSTKPTNGRARTQESENLDDLSDEEIAQRLVQARRAAARVRAAK